MEADKNNHLRSMTHSPFNKDCDHHGDGCTHETQPPCTCPDDRTFSDFIRNGTPEEKQRVYTEVIQESIKDQMTDEEVDSLGALENMVRDFTQVGSRPKSEVRERIQRYAQEAQKLGERDGWKQGELHGIAIGRQREAGIEDTPGSLHFDGKWLTIGDAPSFMISEKLARQLREYVDGIEERQVNGGGTNAK